MHHATPPPPNPGGPQPVRRRVKSYAALDEDGRKVALPDREELVILHPDAGRIDQVDTAHRVFACGADPHEHRAVAQCADCHRSICDHCNCAGPSRDGRFRCDACSREIVDRDGRLHRVGHAEFERWRFDRAVVRVCLVLLSPFFSGGAR